MRLPGSTWIRRSLLGLALTAIACAAIVDVWSLPFVDGLDRQAYDAHLRWQKSEPNDEVVIIDIDERSLAEVGRWPWPRATVAEMATRLTQRGQAAVIGFDILFAEAQAEAGQDQALAASLAKSPSVLSYYFSSDRGGRTSGHLPAPVLDAAAVVNLKISITDWSGFGANLPTLQDEARGAGFFNPIIDPDGVVRALPLLGRYGNQVYESFAVAVLREYLGSASLILRSQSLELQGTRGSVRIPISTGLSAMVPFSGAATVHATPGRVATVRAAGTPVAAGAVGSTGSGRFKTVSAADVVNGKVDWSLFTNRIVLVGTSAPGLTDLRSTPVNETLPGVEIHAALIASALEAPRRGAATTIKQRPADAKGLALVATALAGLVLSLAMPALGALGVIALGLLAGSCLVVWNNIAYSNLGWVLPGAAGIVLVMLLTVLNLTLGYFVEGRARRAVAHLFGEYVSPMLVERMTRDPLRYRSMTSENRELSIMFADIRGFTRIAEAMEPASLREYINEFLTAMTEIIHRYGGTLDKYIGDAVMAFWGAPVEDPAHADQAVAAAIAMLAEVGRLNKSYASRGWPTLSIGIGVNTGIARVGDMGSRLRRAYTVLGDTVNLASRIEALTKQFNTPIIVGEATARKAQAHTFAELAQVSVAGRSEPVRIFVPVALAQTQPMKQSLTEQDAGSKVQSTGDSNDEGTRLRV